MVQHVKHTNIFCNTRTAWLKTLREFYDMHT